MASSKTTAVLTAISTGLHALETIGDAASGLLGISQPTAAQVHAFLEAIVAVVDGFKKGVDGTIDAAAVNAELMKLRASISDNDAAADTLVDQKFPT